MLLVPHQASRAIRSDATVALSNAMVYCWQSRPSDARAANHRKSQRSYLVYMYGVFQITTRLLDESLAYAYGRSAMAHILVAARLTSRGTLHAPY